MQNEKACTDESIINEQNLKFVSYNVDLNALDARHFMLYKQPIWLMKLWFD